MCRLMGMGACPHSHQAQSSNWGIFNQHIWGDYDQHSHEQNDEYQLQHRYMQIEGMAALATPMIEEAQPLQITPKAA